MIGAFSPEAQVSRSSPAAALRPVVTGGAREQGQGSGAEGIHAFRHIELRLVEEKDAALIVALRTHPEKGRFLHPTRASVAAQEEWIRRYQGRERQGSEFYFLATDRHTGQPAGTIRLYDIAGSQFTMGSWITVPGASPWASIESLLAGYDYGFTSLGLTTCLYEVMEQNTHVWQHQVSFGAEVLERRGGFVWFSLSRERYAGIRQRYRRCYLPAGAGPLDSGISA